MTKPYSADTLGMEPEQMRQLGYQVVNLVIERLQQRDAEPALQTGDAGELQEILGGPVPEQAMDPAQSLELLASTALRYQQNGDHPRYFARVPGPSSYAAVLGEWLATGFNSMAASWAGGSGPASLELVVVDWLRQLMDLPETYEGVLLSGGSMANLTAFAAARCDRGAGTVYMSDQTHSSLPRALRELGFSPEQICVLDSDASGRMPPESLHQRIVEDRIGGRKPIMVIANAGTTNMGSVDPLHDIADLCAAESLWLHIDGAYGAPAALTVAGKQYLAGIERADSLVLDPHKWLFQPYDVGCLLIKPGVLEQCYSMNPEYLKDVQAKTGEVDFRNRSLELTRRARASKLWLSMRSYGVERIRQAIDTGIELAEYAESYLRGQPETWELVSPAQIGIVCFALKGCSAKEHSERAQALTDSGYACVSSTSLKGRSALRLCTINPLTRKVDIVETIDRLAGKRV